MRPKDRGRSERANLLVTESFNGVEPRSPQSGVKPADRSSDQTDNEDYGNDRWTDLDLERSNEIQSETQDDRHQYARKYTTKA